MSCVMLAYIFSHGTTNGMQQQHTEINTITLKCSVAVIISNLNLKGLYTKHGLAFRCVADKAPNKRWYIQPVQNVSMYVH